MKEIALIIQSLLSTYIISCERILQVWIHLFPLIYCRNDAQLNDLVAHLAEVLVRLVQGSNLLSSTCRLCEVNDEDVELTVKVTDTEFLALLSDNPTD